MLIKPKSITIRSYPFAHGNLVRDRVGVGRRVAVDVVPPSVGQGQDVNAVLFLPVVGVVAVPVGVGDGLACGRPNEPALGCTVIGP